MTDKLTAASAPLALREWLEMADELISWRDACTQNSSGGDGEFRVECSSGSAAQARGLRASLKRAADMLRSLAAQPQQADAGMREALEKIACRHVTEQPLWWQSEARAALGRDSVRRRAPTHALARR